ncbi:phosphatase [Olsenella uli]|uniref:Ppx/GppA phosphatase family protein n=1 Tax=Olsenella uli TaxID=133926 RepID=UPI001957ADB5|nr:phosphatase [Olsenella uli]MBM6676907.1 phosphatase [Olsenella uli]
MTRLACIDIGTVTARLAVADVEGGRVLRLVKHSEICNLGQDVDATGRLDEEAMARVVACVRGYVASAREAGAVAACCTLTSAARDAENAAVLGAELDALGLDPLIIPGQVEGALTFLGVTRDFPGRRVLVADNGGGSTELACGCAPEDGPLDLRFVRSIDVGCRRVTEKFLSPEGPDDPGAVARAHEFAAAAFGPTVREDGLRAAGSEGATDGAPATLVVTGGTVTSLVAVKKELDPYDPAQVHLAELTRADLEELEGRLAALTVAERAELPGLVAKRAPVILGGVVAVLELMRQTGFERLTVSESDLLFGLAIAAETTLRRVESPVGWGPTMRVLR